jgi:uncharacterized protein (UPF0333 family)
MLFAPIEKGQGWLEYILVFLLVVLIVVAVILLIQPFVPGLIAWFTSIRW